MFIVGEIINCFVRVDFQVTCASVQLSTFKVVESRSHLKGSLIGK